MVCMCSYSHLFGHPPIHRYAAQFATHTTVTRRRCLLRDDDDSLNCALFLHYTLDNNCSARSIVLFAKRVLLEELYSSHTKLFA